MIADLVEVDGDEVGPPVPGLVVAGGDHVQQRRRVVLARRRQVREVPEVVDEHQRPGQVVHGGRLGAVVARPLHHPLGPVCKQASNKKHHPSRASETASLITSIRCE